MEYYDLLARIHEHLAPRTYVEIGVRNGESLSRALPTTHAVGIDPDMEITYPIPPRTDLFHQTSDDFFATHDLHRVLHGEPFDLAFIDGMHLFEFALRDFVNLERHAAPGSAVLVHDCLPIDAETSARDRTTMVWSGDVWKLIACLEEHRPDLDVTTLSVPPTGLGVIRNLDPTSTVLRDRLDELCAHYVAVGYDDLLASDKDEVLNVVGWDWPTVAEVVGPSMSRGGRARAAIRSLRDRVLAVLP